MNYKIDSFVLFRRILKENIKSGYYTTLMGETKVIPKKALETLKRYWVK
jgi:hypothetical protein